MYSLKNSPDFLMKIEGKKALKREIRETLQDLKNLHKEWKNGKRTLKWWRNETGYISINIRRLCRIPISHPSSPITISCIYILQLDYVYSITKYEEVRKLVQIYRQEVVTSLNLKMEKLGVPSWDFKFF